MGTVCASPTPKGHTLPPVKRKGNQTTLMMLSSILFLVAAACCPRWCCCGWSTKWINWTGSREPCCWPCSFGGLWPWSPSWWLRLWPISSLIFSPGVPSSTSFWPILWCRDSLERGSSTGFFSGAPGMSPILTTGLTAWCTGSLSPWALPRWRMCCMCSPPAFHRGGAGHFLHPGHAMFGVVMGEAMSRAKWLEVHGQREQAGAAGGGPGFAGGSPRSV